MKASEPKQKMFVVSVDGVEREVVVLGDLGSTVVRLMEVNELATLSVEPKFVVDGDVAALRASVETQR